MTRWTSAALIGAALCFATPAIAQKPADYTAALAAPGRPADQVALDAGRRPAEVLPFLGLRKNMVAADIMAGEGYYSDIIARVVGPKGKVFAYNPIEFVKGDDKNKAAWAALTDRLPTVSYAEYPFKEFAAPANSFDFVLLHLAYHDIYWESAKFEVPRADPAAFVKAIYAATKPGGIVGVVDHVALPGDPRASVDKLHRIDPAVIKADFVAAGFKLEAESDLLRMPGDDHSKHVYNPEIRGKTDRVVLRFRKPRK